MWGSTVGVILRHQLDRWGRWVKKSLEPSRGRTPLNHRLRRARVRRAQGASRRDPEVRPLAPEVP
eukprot:2462508-Alexandrium_andersonii.AAC.1